MRRIPRSMARARSGGMSWGMVSTPQGVVHGPLAELVQVPPSPLDHLPDALLESDLRLPAHVTLDRARVQPVARVLPEAVRGHLAELVARDPHHPRHRLPQGPE